MTHSIQSLTLLIEGLDLELIPAPASSAYPRTLKWPVKHVSRMRDVHTFVATVIVKALGWTVTSTMKTRRCELLRMICSRSGTGIGGYVRG